MFIQDPFQIKHYFLKSQILQFSYIPNLKRRITLDFRANARSGISVRSFGELFFFFFYCMSDADSVSWASSSSSRQGRSPRWRQWSTWWWRRVTPDTAWPLLLIWNSRANRGLSETHLCFVYRDHHVIPELCVFDYVKNSHFMPLSAVI